MLQSHLPIRTDGRQIQTVDSPTFFSATHLLGCMPPFCGHFSPSRLFSVFTYHLIPPIPISWARRRWRKDADAVTPPPPNMCWEQTSPCPTPKGSRLEAGRPVNSVTTHYLNSPLCLPFLSLSCNFHPPCLLLLGPP